jgi:hypothetical protein
MHSWYWSESRRHSVHTVSATAAMYTDRHGLEHLIARGSVNHPMLATAADHPSPRPLDSNRRAAQTGPAEMGERGVGREIVGNFSQIVQYERA